jgi:trehalose 6-phosphate phosphatase
LFAPLKLAAAGDHGAEARFDATAAPRMFAPAQARRSLDAVSAEVRSRLDAASRVRFEQKRFSIAFHYRGAEAEEPRLRDIVRAALAPHDAALQLLDGELCLDVKLRGEDKGKVIGRFLGVAPFHGRVPVYAGDAETDEDGFAMAVACGGRAIRVVNGQSRPTRATETVATPAELRDWLAGSAAALSD